MNKIIIVLFSFFACSSLFAATERYEEICFDDVGGECVTVYFNKHGYYELNSQNLEIVSVLREHYPYSFERGFNIQYTHPISYQKLKAEHNIQQHYTSSTSLFEDFMAMPDEQWAAWKDTVYCAGAVVSCGAAGTATTGTAGWALPAAIVACVGAAGQCGDAVRSVNKWLAMKRKAELDAGIDWDAYYRATNDKIRDHMGGTGGGDGPSGGGPSGSKSPESPATGGSVGPKRTGRVTIEPNVRRSSSQ